MRENMGLYRGKRKDNGEWVEGGIVVNGDYVAIVQYSDYHGWHEFIEVIPETVGECTRLPGKNGKLIFEGDILQSGNIKGTVKYSNKRAAFVFKWKRFTSHGGDFFKECILSDFGGFSSLAVIGNIHDNPELLEVNGDA